MTDRRRNRCQTLQHETPLLTLAQAEAMVAAERERWQELVEEMRHMADHVEMPGGDYCSVSISMWAEYWLMKLKS